MSTYYSIKLKTITVQYAVSITPGGGVSEAGFGSPHAACAPVAAGAAGAATTAAACCPFGAHHATFYFRVHTGYNEAGERRLYKNIGMVLFIFPNPRWYACRVHAGTRKLENKEPGSLWWGWFTPHALII